MLGTIPVASSIGSRKIGREEEIGKQEVKGIVRKSISQNSRSIVEFDFAARPHMRMCLGSLLRVAIDLHAVRFSRGRGKYCQHRLRQATRGLLMRWQNPPRPSGCAQAPPDGSFRTVGMMGMQVDRPVLDVPEILEQLDKLKSPDAILVDRATRSEYGPENCRSFSDADIGHSCELGNRASLIAGHFQLGTGLATNGAVLLSDVGYAYRSGIDTRERASLGLVRLKSGVDPNDAKAELLDWLSKKDPRILQQVQLYTMAEQLTWERTRWLRETPIGMIFTMGVVLSFIIGAAIVYMILANDVANRLPEYATLKAMGYSQFALARIVIMQSWFLAILSYLPAMIVAVALYQVTASLSKIPTVMTWERTFGVLGLALLMCTVSAAMAMLKLWKAEPASLF